MYVDDDFYSIFYSIFGVCFKKEYNPQVRIQRGGQGVLRPPLENHKLYGFL